MSPPGFYDLPAAAYHADPCEVPSLSASAAHTLISRSPAHAWREHPRLGGMGKPRTDAMDLGTIVHALLLGGSEIVRPLPFADFRTKEARAARDEARASGLVPVSAPIAAKAAALGASISLELQRTGIALAGQSEVTAIWREEASPAPVLCRARLDHIDGRTIYDLKIVERASDDAVRRHMMAFGSHIQAAAYTRAVEQLRPELAGRARFVFLFAEVDTGFVHPVTLGGSMRELGRQQWVRACFTWSRCLASGKWPGYGPTTVEAPTWALAAEEEAVDAMRRIPLTIHEVIDG